MLRHNLLAATAKRRAAQNLTYATWNSFDKDAAYTLSNEDKTVIRSGPDGNTSLRATLPKTSGKWYFEITWPNGLTSGDGALALASSTTLVLDTYPGAVADSFLYYPASTGAIQALRFSCDNLTANLPISVGTVHTMAVDLDAMKAWIGADGSWFGGDPITGTAAPITWSAMFPICITQRLYGNGTTCTLNAGQDAFVYSPPSGFNPGWYE